MADTRNTQHLLDVALTLATADAEKRPVATRKLVGSLVQFGEAHGFDQVALAFGDALLISAARHMAMAEKAARRNKVDDGPEVGDHVEQANRVLGIYEQVNATYAVAAASKK